MDSGGLNHEEELLDQDEVYTAETSPDHLLSPDSADTDDTCDDQPESSRLGDRYQAKIPPLVTEIERLQLQHDPTSIDDMLGAGPVGYPLGLGLAIPIMWIHHVGDQIQYETQGNLNDDAVGFFDNKGSQCLQVNGCPTDSSTSLSTLPQVKCKVDFLNETVEKGVYTVLPELQPMIAEAYVPLPESPVFSWSDAETQSFLLGLYIFGKNLSQVKKFVGNKEMGDILSFYYGKFYRSNAHRRWSECRKIRSRKLAHGQRIFMGWRQQELLSRLVCRVPKEVQDNLAEAAKSFNDGRTSLEEFVSALKSNVGIDLLVKAVGIGKGKHDLTGNILELPRSNQPTPARSEIPSGKACSALSSGAIVKFLTGDFRLSKAKSNDLFWEAVWPRLLARGWRSEQPKHLSSVGGKNPLVFIVPGVKKFSRKRLTKGEHYYDSVPDVLNKVALDPLLLVLEGEGGGGNGGIEDENGSDVVTDGTKFGKKGRDNRRRCSLGSKLPDCSSELVKFTVVDTSLVEGEPPFKVRELRSLPMDTNLCEIPSGDSGGTENDSSGELLGSAVKKLGDSNICKSDASSDHLVSDSKRQLSENGHGSTDQCWRVINDKQPEKDMKCQYRRRTKSIQPKYLSQVKRQRLSACMHAGTDPRFSSGEHLLQKEAASGDQKLNDFDGTEASPSQGKVSAGSSAKGDLNESIKCSSGTGCVETVAIIESVASQEKALACTLIDLNIPQFPPDFDGYRPFCMEMDGGDDGLNPKHQSDDPQMTDPCKGAVSMQQQQQPITNGRRLGTRNRPPTTKALEALACGFLSTKRKGRNSKALPSSDSVSRPSRRARKTAEVPVSAPALVGPNVVPSYIRANVEFDSEESNQGTPRVSETHVRPEGKGITTL